MKNYNELKRLREGLLDHQAKTSTLEKRLGEKQVEKVTLEEEALKERILETKGWEKKQEAVETISGEIENIKKEIESAKSTATILDGEMKKIRNNAIREIRGALIERYEKAARVLCQKLHEAEKLERELLEIKKEAQAMMVKAGLALYEIPLPGLPRVVVEQDGDSKKYSPINRLLEAHKEAGFKI